MMDGNYIDEIYPLGQGYSYVVDVIGDAGVKFLHYISYSGTDVFNGTMTHEQSSDQFTKEVLQKLGNKEMLTLVVMAFCFIIWVMMMPMAWYIFCLKKKYFSASPLQLHLACFAVIFLLTTSLALCLFGGCILLLSESQMNSTLPEGFYWTKETVVTAFELKRNFLNHFNISHVGLVANLDNGIQGTYDFNEKCRTIVRNETHGLFQNAIDEYRETENVYFQPADINPQSHVDDTRGRNLLIKQNDSRVKSIIGQWLQLSCFDLMDDLEAFLKSLNNFRDNINQTATRLNKDAAQLHELWEDIKVEAEEIYKNNTFFPVLWVLNETVHFPILNIEDDVEMLGSLSATAAKDIHSKEIVRDIRQMKSNFGAALGKTMINTDSLTEHLRNAATRVQEELYNVSEETHKVIQRTFPDEMVIQLKQEITSYKETIQQSFGLLYTAIAVLGIGIILLTIVLAFGLSTSFVGMAFYETETTGSKLKRCGLKVLKCSLGFAVFFVIVYWVLIPIGYLLSLIPLLMCESFGNGHIFDLTLDNPFFWKGTNYSSLPWRSAFAPRQWDIKFGRSLWRCRNRSGMYEAFNFDSVFPDFTINVSGIKYEFPNMELKIEDQLKELPQLNLSLTLGNETELLGLLDKFDFNSVFSDWNHFMRNVSKLFSVLDRLETLPEHSELRELKNRAVTMNNTLSNVTAFLLHVVSGSYKIAYNDPLKETKSRLSKISTDLRNLRLTENNINYFFKNNAKDVILQTIESLAQHYVNGVKFTADYWLYFVRHKMTGCFILWKGYVRSATGFCRELLRGTCAAWFAVFIIAVFLVFVVTCSFTAAAIFLKISPQSEDPETTGDTNAVDGSFRDQPDQGASVSNSQEVAGYSQSKAKDDGEVAEEATEDTKDQEDRKGGKTESPQPTDQQNVPREESMADSHVEFPSQTDVIRESPTSFLRYSLPRKSVSSHVFLSEQEMQMSRFPRRVHSWGSPLFRTEETEKKGLSKDVKQQRHSHLPQPIDIQEVNSHSEYSSDRYELSAQTEMPTDSSRGNARNLLKKKSSSFLELLSKEGKQVSQYPYPLRSCRSSETTRTEEAEERQSDFILELMRLNGIDVANDNIAGTFESDYSEGVVGRKPAQLSELVKQQDDNIRDQSLPDLLEENEEKTSDPSLSSFNALSLETQDEELTKEDVKCEDVVPVVFESKSVHASNLPCNETIPQSSLLWTSVAITVPVLEDGAQMSEVNTDRSVTQQREFEVIATHGLSPDSIQKTEFPHSITSRENKSPASEAETKSDDRKVQLISQSEFELLETILFSQEESDSSHAHVPHPALSIKEVALEEKSEQKASSQSFQTLQELVLSNGKLEESSSFELSDKLPAHIANPLENEFNLAEEPTQQTSLLPKLTKGQIWETQAPSESRTEKPNDVVMTAKPEVDGDQVFSKSNWLQPRNEINFERSSSYEKIQAQDLSKEVKCFEKHATAIVSECRDTPQVFAKSEPLRQITTLKSSSGVIHKAVPLPCSNGTPKWKAFDQNQVVEIVEYYDSISNSKSEPSQLSPFKMLVDSRSDQREFLRSNGTKSPISFEHVVMKYDDSLTELVDQMTSSSAPDGDSSGTAKNEFSRSASTSPSLQLGRVAEQHSSGRPIIKPDSSSQRNTQEILDLHDVGAFKCVSTSSPEVLHQQAGTVRGAKPLERLEDLGDCTDNSSTRFERPGTTSSQLISLKDDSSQKETKGCLANPSSPFINDSSEEEQCLEKPSPSFIITASDTLDPIGGIQPPQCTNSSCSVPSLPQKQIVSKSECIPKAEIFAGVQTSLQNDKNALQSESLEKTASWLKSQKQIIAKDKNIFITDMQMQSSDRSYNIVRSPQSEGSSSIESWKTAAQEVHSDNAQSLGTQSLRSSSVSPDGLYANVSESDVSSTSSSWSPSSQVLTKNYSDDFGTDLSESSSKSSSKASPEKNNEACCLKVNHSQTYFNLEVPSSLNGNFDLALPDASGSTPPQMIDQFGLDIQNKGQSTSNVKTTAQLPKRTADIGALEIDSRSQSVLLTNENSMFFIPLISSKSSQEICNDLNFGSADPHFPSTVSASSLKALTSKGQSSLVAKQSSKFTPVISPQPSKEINSLIATNHSDTHFSSMVLSSSGNAATSRCQAVLGVSQSSTFRTPPALTQSSDEVNVISSDAYLSPVRTVFSLPISDANSSTTHLMDKSQQSLPICELAAHVAPQSGLIFGKGQCHKAEPVWKTNKLSSYLLASISPPRKCQRDVYQTDESVKPPLFSKLSTRSMDMSFPQAVPDGTSNTTVTITDHRGTYLKDESERSATCESADNTISEAPQSSLDGKSFEGSRSFHSPTLSSFLADTNSDEGEKRSQVVSKDTISGHPPSNTQRGTPESPFQHVESYSVVDQVISPFSLLTPNQGQNGTDSHNFKAQFSSRSFLAFCDTAVSSTVPDSGSDIAVSVSVTSEADSKDERTSERDATDSKISLTPRSILESPIPNDQYHHTEEILKSGQLYCPLATPQPSEETIHCDAKKANASSRLCSPSTDDAFIQAVLNNESRTTMSSRKHSKNERVRTSQVDISLSSQSCLSAETSESYFNYSATTTELNHSLFSSSTAAAELSQETSRLSAKCKMVPSMHLPSHSVYVLPTFTSSIPNDKCSTAALNPDTCGTVLKNKGHGLSKDDKISRSLQKNSYRKVSKLSQCGQTKSESEANQSSYSSFTRSPKYKEFHNSSKELRTSRMPLNTAFSRTIVESEYSTEVLIPEQNGPNRTDEYRSIKSVTNTVPRPSEFSELSSSQYMLATPHAVTVIDGNSDKVFFPCLSIDRAFPLSDSDSDDNTTILIPDDFGTDIKGDDLNSSSGESADTQVTWLSHSSSEILESQCQHSRENSDFAEFTSTSTQISSQKSSNPAKTKDSNITNIFSRLRSHLPMTFPGFHKK